jgi:O-acetylhomoserine (thiol)-lyase
MWPDRQLYGLSRSVCSPLQEGKGMTTDLSSDIDAGVDHASTVSTRILHVDRMAEVGIGAVHAPMHTSVLYGYRSSQELQEVFQGHKPGFTYARQGNPTSAALEAKLNLLEEARATICFATGMAAISATFFALLRAGDHVVSSRYVFGNTASVLRTLQGFGVEVSYVDSTDASLVAAALQPNTKLVFVETIANPRTQVADLAAIGALCRPKNVVFVVDNTMTTPELFKARAVGASLVINSLTKGIAGHADAMGGAVSDTGLFDWLAFPNIDPLYRTGDPANWGVVQIRRKGLRDFGGALRPEDAHRIGLGAETLKLRITQTNANAFALAHWLQAQPQVANVYYPGLASHPQHRRASELFGGRYGALISFDLADADDTFKVLDALRIVTLSTHLSDNRTLAIPVASTIFFELGEPGRAAMGISPGLVRLSVGIEDIQDLIADFAQAMGRSIAR